MLDTFIITLEPQILPPVVFPMSIITMWRLHLMTSIFIMFEEQQDQQSPYRRVDIITILRVTQQ